MKKLLIITNLFHSSPRIPGLCKYLHEFGWEPVILATPLGENPEAKYGPSKEFVRQFRVIEVEYFDIVGFLKGFLGFKKQEGSRSQLEKKFGGKSLIKPLIKKALIWAGAIIAYPDEMRNWRKPAIKEGKKLLDSENFDVILTSSSPVTSHLVAKALKKSSGLPWLADSRDLWTQNHAYPFPFWRKFFETKLEKKTLRVADVLSTVSDGTAQKLRERYSPKPVFVIHNGFDPKTTVEQTSLTKKFTITYTGQIYQKKQDLKKFFIATRELLNEEKLKKENIALYFYGSTQTWFNELVRQYELEDVVSQLGIIPREEAFKKQRESQVLLMLGWEDKYELGVFPTKLFEYFAARRPILATGGTLGEEFRKILDKTKAGQHPITIPEIKNVIVEYYDDYHKNGKVSYHGISKEMAEYDYRHMAKKFVTALEESIKINNGKLR